MKKDRRTSRRIFCVMFFTSLLCPGLQINGQVPKGNRQAANTQGKPKCSGAWTGTISYSRTQNQSNSKTVQRVSNRGEDRTDFEFIYDYKARVAVTEAPDKTGASIGRASINHHMSSTETGTATEQNSCDRGKSWRDMKGTFTSKSETSGTDGAAEANVNVGLNADGTYSVSVGLPQIRGKVTGSQTSTFSGQCTPKEGKSTNLPATETSIDGHSITSDGRNRINENDPYRISGSYSLASPGDVTETITWNLQKCGAPLRITDLKFEDMKFPNWNDWQEVVEQKGTIDGNLVKIKATVLNASGETRYANLSFKETFKGDKWDGAKPDMPLRNDEVSFSLEAGEQRDIEMAWDTSGYAWFDDGRPRLIQRVKAEIWESNKLVDDMTKNIKIAPKPVVLVHGLWSDWRQFEVWQNILTTSHSYDWKAFPVGEKPDKGLMDTGGKFLSGAPGKTVSQNALALKSYITYAQEDRNAWHVDVVAHQSGGLIARNYISQLMTANAGDGLPQISHLIMLGTPNLGSPCADVMYLLSGNLAMYQTTQDFAIGFNRVNKERKGVHFAALAGDPLPTMCKKIEWNDGFVSVPSATWTISDHATSKSISPDLTGTRDFSDFVKPHLAIGPKGEHGPDIQTPPTGSVAVATNRLYGALFSTQIMTGFSQAKERSEIGGFETSTPFGKDLKLDPRQNVEIEIPVEAASNFGITFMADANVSATLFDAAGIVAGKNLAKTPESRGWFRSIFYDRATTPGTWKLRLENTGAEESRVLMTSWTNAGK